MKEPLQEGYSRFLREDYLFWLPSVYLILHSLEELPEFANWVSEHFSSYSTELFVYTHIAIWLLIFLISFKASLLQSHVAWAILAVATQIQFGVNALFHITTTILFNEYSPGLLTAATLGLIFSYYVIRRVISEELLTKQQLSLAAIVGITIACLAIATLFLH